MGGQRWAFVTQGRQYAAFSAGAEACPEHAESWKFWRTNAYVEGNFLLRCGAAATCCPHLRIGHAPFNGSIGSPPVSIAGHYEWNNGGYDCKDCGAQVSIEPVSEHWMGGTRWTFIVHGKQYPVYAGEMAACPCDTAVWKFWAGSQGYVDGDVYADCEDEEKDEWRGWDEWGGSAFGHSGHALHGGHSVIVSDPTSAGVEGGGGIATLVSHGLRPARRQRPPPQKVERSERLKSPDDDDHHGPVVGRDVVHGPHGALFGDWLAALLGNEARLPAIPFLPAILALYGACMTCACCALLCWLSFRTPPTKQRIRKGKTVMPSSEREASRNGHRNGSWERSCWTPPHSDRDRSSDRESSHHNAPRRSKKKVVHKGSDNESSSSVV